MKKELSTFVVLSVVLFVSNRLAETVFRQPGGLDTGVLAVISRLVGNEGSPQPGKTLLTSTV